MNFIKKIFNGSNKINNGKPSNKLPVMKSNNVLTAFDVAEKLEIDRRKLEQTFVGLGWTEKSARGIVATQEGVNNGAQTKYHDMSKNNYVVWDEGILNNETLKASLKDD